MRSRRVKVWLLVPECLAEESLPTSGAAPKNCANRRTPLIQKSTLSTFLGLILPAVRYLNRLSVPFLHFAEDL